MTSLLKQYHEARAKYPGMLLLLRVGDYYELFGEDAFEVGALLDLEIWCKHELPMIAFPHKDLEAYLRKLLRAGKRVAICEQVAEAPKGATVERVVMQGSLFE